MVSEKTKHLQLIPRQQTQLLSGIHPDQFGFVGFPLLEQAFKDHKQKWVSSLSDERMASVTLVAAMDQLAEASHQLKQLMKSALPKNLQPPKEQDSYNLDLLFKELLESLHPYILGSLF